MIEEVVLPPLTEDNYYQDRHYMSTSRFKEYIKCPLRQQVVDLFFGLRRRRQKAYLLVIMSILILRLEKLMKLFWKGIEIR